MLIVFFAGRRVGESTSGYPCDVRRMGKLKLWMTPYGMVRCDAEHEGLCVDEQRVEYKDQQ